jgi:hypothetical protein
MTPGQRVRVRPASRMAQRKDIPAEALGVVICSYRVRSRLGEPERVDVRLSNTTLWGVPPDEFEVVGENDPAHA